MSDHTIKASDIISYLNNHPDFFMRYPDLLEGLKVSNEKGQLTSLVHHQVHVLQNKLNQNNLKLKTLINNGHSNEKLMNKLFMLLCELAVERKKNFVSHYIQFIQRHLPTDFFRIFLHQPYAGKKATCDIKDYQPVQSHFENFKTDSQPISGRIRTDKLKALFPARYTEIRSSTILPIGKNATFGIIFFGSRDEEKFHPSSSTDILQKLTAILAFYFDGQYGDKNHATG